MISGEAVMKEKERQKIKTTRIISFLGKKRKEEKKKTGTYSFVE